MPNDVTSDERVHAPREDLVRSVPFDLVRAEGDDGLTLTGYGAVFNEWTTIKSWEGEFEERIAPGAFKKTLSEQAGRVRLQFDHGQHPLIGSLPIGTIRKLREDTKGLYVEARLSDNWLIQPVRDAIAAGSVDGMSFRFAVDKEQWENLDGKQDGLPRRTIQEVRLMEVGPVVWPAYEGTSVGVRSRQLAEELLRADDETRREIARLITAPLEERDDILDPEPPDEGTRVDPVPDDVADTPEPADATRSEEPATATPPATPSGRVEPRPRKRTRAEREQTLAYISERLERSRRRSEEHAPLVRAYERAIGLE